MKGLMMDFQLTLPTILKRAETYFPHQEIVTRMPDKSFHRYSFADFGKRARQLAVALKGLGLEPGDRVATLCWNHYQHLEAYLGIPCGGYVLHTLNLRLHPNDLGYIATHAGDKAVIVDKSLLPLWEQFKDKTDIEHVFVVEDSYEELLAGANPDDYEDPRLDEDTAAAMCYTSGTTGMPKGVLYSHRSTVLHTLGQALAAPLGLHVTEKETLLPVVPMFHANAWGYPYTCLMVRAPSSSSRARSSTRRRCSTTSSRRASRSPPACRRSGWASSACSTRSPTAGTSRSCTRCSSAARRRRAR